jgi:hypothetical protein
MLAIEIGLSIITVEKAYRYADFSSKYSISFSRPIGS